MIKKPAFAIAAAVGIPVATLIASPASANPGDGATETYEGSHWTIVHDTQRDVRALACRIHTGSNEPREIWLSLDWTHQTGGVTRAYGVFDQAVAPDYLPVRTTVNNPGDEVSATWSASGTWRISATVVTNNGPGDWSQWYYYSDLQWCY